MLLSRNVSRRRPWAILLVVSALLIVACDAEITVTETTDPPQAEVTSETDTSPETETTAGTDLPSDSATTTAPQPPTARPDRKAVPTSSEVKAKAEAEAAQAVVPEVAAEEEEILLAEEFSEGAMVRYEAIETAIADGNLEQLMGYCIQATETCTETLYTFLSKTADNATESLWNVEIITHTTSFFDNDDPGIWDINPASTQVLCSTTRPMVVDFDGTEYTVNHISAGSPQIYAFAGLQEPDALYWKVCHDQDYPLPDEVPELAANLGYDLSTEPRTVQQDFIELLEP